MFSVNNFYNIIESHYCSTGASNLLLTFRPHGSKDWNDLSYWATPELPLSDVRLQGHMIMHDQEPCFPNMLTTYRDSVLEQKKSIQCLHHLSSSQIDNFVETVSDSDPFELFHLIWKFAKKPIICHSEINSPDIAEFRANNFIDCYYWWHGMIARDWFRHWHYHKQLAVANKSAAAKRFLLYARATDGTRTYRTKIINFFKEKFNWHGKDVSSCISAEIDVVDANKYAIHVVAETLFDTQKIYLTEKVFKPMVMSQPFILFAPPGSLAYLKNYGFKTFDSVWDESYDSISDHKTRKDKVLSLIDQLSQVSDAEFSIMYEKMLPIIDYNRKWFFSQDFQDLLINELHHNLANAFREQAEAFASMPGDPWISYLDRIAQNKKLPNHWLEWLRESAAIDKNLMRTVEYYPTLRSLI